MWGLERSCGDHVGVLGLGCCDLPEHLVCPDQSRWMIESGQQPVLALFLHALEDEASVCLLVLSLGGAVQLFEDTVSENETSNFPQLWF